MTITDLDTNVTTNNQQQNIQKSSLQTKIKKSIIKNVENYNIKEDLQKLINERFDKMEDKFKTFEILLRDLQRATQLKTTTVSDMPNILPIISNESLERFQNCSKEEFDNCGNIREKFERSQRRKMRMF